MLDPAILPIDQLSAETIDEMFNLMTRFYDNLLYENFLSDLRAKDKVILLLSSEKEVCGFTTLKLFSFPLKDGTVINGVFSGDTIIAKEHWGSTQLFRAFTREIIPLAQKYEHFYWFLISKGHKTYQMLPLFFKEFYPNLKSETPPFHQEVMDGYAAHLFPDEYNPVSGLVEYSGETDFLKGGVADEDTIRSGNKHARYFLQRNPTHGKGNDLVCLASFKKENLRSSVLRMITL